MPGESGVTVVTTLVCFILFRTRGCGRSERPAFPAPSNFWKGGTFKAKLGRIRREIAKLCCKRRCLKIELGSSSPQTRP
jgi:hypothetical protein